MRILLVIDMQNDFLEGALRNEEGIKIIPNVINKINENKKNNDIIIATRDTHQANYLGTQEGKNLPVEHCIEGTEGWEINDEVKAALGNALVFDKPTFGSVDLASYLYDEYNGIEKELEIELVGVCTDICVISNALLIKANLPEAQISLDASCCAGVTVDSHKAANNAMRSCQIKIKGE